MIQNPNTSNDSLQEEASKMLNLSQKKNFNINDIPIHTMKEDLEFLKNPSLKKTAFQNDLQEKSPEEELTPKQKTSPFMNNPIGNTPSPTRPENIIPETSELPSTVSIEHPQSVSGKKFDTFFYIIVAVLVIALISLGYYFWGINKQKVTEETINIPETTNEPEEIAPTLSYSQENPNYIQLEFETIDSLQLQKELKKFMDVVRDEKYLHALEFVITDSTNKRITFSEFASKIGLGLSPAVISNLGDNFNIFIFNDTTPKIGLSIETKNRETMEKIMLDEEINLANELKPIMFTENFNSGKEFGNSEYKSAKIRYQNLESSEPLSIDYTTYGNLLIIGTSKDTLRSIIDRLSKPENENIISKEEILPAKNLEEIETSQNTPETTNQ